MYKFYLTLFFISFLFSQQLSAQTCPDSLQASFDFLGKTRFCQGQDVPIINNSVGDDDGKFYYIWDFGDGSKKDTAKSKINNHHIFDLYDSCMTTSEYFKQFTINLKMYRFDETTCYSKTTKDIFISRRPKPAFSAVPQNVCLENPNVVFTDSTCPSTGVTFKWQFNDASSGANDSSNLKSLTHKFVNAGSHIVTLYISSSACGESSTSKDVIVLDSATANASFNVPTPSCVTSTIKFTNKSKNSVGFNWSISSSSGWIYANNSNANSTDISVTFLKIGTYKVSLTTKNACGSDKIWSGQVDIKNAAPSIKISKITPICQNTSAQPVLESSNEGNLPTTYSWTIQNGTPSTFSGKNPPAIAFSDTGWVRLTAKNDCGITLDSTFVSVSSLAKADAKVQNIPTKSCGPFTVKMQNNSAGAQSNNWQILRSDGSVIQIQDSISFKNGTNNTSLNPEIEFRSPGKFFVKLQISNNCGGGNLNWQSDVIEVIKKPNINFAPVSASCLPANVSFKISVDSGGTALKSVQFKLDSNGIVKNYDSFNNLQFTFNSGGKITATAIASNICGETYAQQNIQIVQNGIVDVNVDKFTNPICAPFILKPKNNSLGALTNAWSVSRADGSVIQKSDSISFVNNTSNSSVNPEIQFKSAGKFIINLQITNNCAGGKLSWQSDIIEVIKTPTINFAPVLSNCLPTVISFKIGVDSGGSALKSVQFKLDSNGIVKNYDSFNNLQFTFNSGGKITATAIASNICGETYVQQNIQIVQNGIVDVNVDKFTNPICAPFILKPKNNSLGALTNDWLVLRADSSVTQTSDSISYVNNTSNSSVNPEIQFKSAGKFIIKLQITNNCAGGKLSWQSEIIELNKRPRVAFDTINPVCAPKDVAFKVSVDSNNIALSNFIFIVDSSNTLTNFQSVSNLHFNFTTPGNYNASAKATNICGTDSVNQKIRILESAKTNVKITDLPTKLCAPFQVSIKNASLGAVFYKWTILNIDAVSGNPTIINTATSAEPTIDFLKLGRYIVNLELGNACGTNPKWSSDTINVIEPPKVRIDTLNLTDCQPVTLSPKLKELDFGADTSQNLIWMFENGTPVQSTNKIPGEISFLSAGSFKISVTATNQCSSAVDTKTITVLSRQNPQINLKRDTFCTSEAPFLLNVTPANGSLWFNNTQNKTDLIFRPSLYNDSVKIKYSVGVGRCTDSTVRTVKVFGTGVFAGRDTAFCDTATKAFQLVGATPLGGKWKGDGITESGFFTPTSAGAGAHVLTYNFEENRAHCINTSKRTIEINNKPKAIIQVDSFGCKNLPVNLNGANSIYASNFKWNFSDNTTSSGSNVSHAFQKSGNFIIQLKVGTSAGCQDSLIMPITISEPPVLDIVAPKLEGCSGIFFYFKNRKIDLKTSYAWIFGNNQKSILAQPDSVLFTNPRFIDTIYKVVAQAITKSCPSIDTTLNIRIFARTKAEFLTSLDTACSGQPISFKNQSLNARTNEWNFGNGKTSTLNNPTSQTYTSDTVQRNYTIKLFAGGCNIDTASRIIVVKAAQLRAFVDIGDSVRCSGIPILIRTKTSDSTSILYRFEDGSTAFGDSIYHNFNRVGRNTFTTIYNNGCEVDSSIRSINILITPTVKFNYTTPEVCKSDSFLFKNLTVNGDAYQWQFPEGKTSNSNNPFFVFTNAGNNIVGLVSKNFSSGCSSTDSALIQVNLPLSLKNIKAIHPKCYANFGSIYVNLDSLTSGFPPYIFSLNDSFSNATGLFTNLFSPNTYTIKVKDSKGCKSEQQVVLTSPPTFAIDAGSSHRINLGDSVRVQAVANRAGPIQFLWDSLQGVGCRTCAETWLRPFRNTTFIVTGKDTAGCEAKTKLFISVNDTGHIFVPNVFSPNKDGYNDIFLPLTDLSVSKILKFEIYNRWGKQVFSQYNFSIVNGFEGWDGGEEKPDIFAWKLEVEFLSGDKRTFEGDVTLIR